MFFTDVENEYFLLNEPIHILELELTVVKAPGNRHSRIKCLPFTPEG